MKQSSRTRDFDALPGAGKNLSAPEMAAPSTACTTDRGGLLPFCDVDIKDGPEVRAACAVSEPAPG
ncbi:hypothetical protein [Paraburkholderia nodosa]|uniref:hypothetical protein n=1 Tax=Paraburkholderia nodosa TaxID=392320 RepID=UPI00048A01A2|nr:hypothetical protein [Paraburkholderia nodosa]